MHYFTTCPSPVGTLTLACDGGGCSLVGLWIEGQKYHGGAIAGSMAEDSGAPVLAAAKMWLGRYFAGEKPAISELALAPIGSEFRQTVWQLLREIPYGEVASYASIAQKAAARMGRASMASRAVGGAVGHNPISIVIPCHRVVGADGSLTGYAGGIGTKARLLELEGAGMSSLFAPKKSTAP
ncbi:MAG: methylated-DNA--[protein]-cysteine S-methyltransferase [Clostridiales bacterium]|jgi:methylated-DNA-[protein]-cysteine S-methyltransferase|nr:methylated-DNA--[protein]-cysteine S-methyltransferase [Clostridiales bacterium]